MKLVFAVTHHKRQGATLDRVVLDIGEREINDGQTFTALSRCRDINNMLLEDFSQERLQAIGNSASSPARLAALDWIRSLEDQTRQRFGLPPLTREPRPARPPTAGRRGGMGRGRASRKARETVSGRTRGRGSGRASGRAGGRDNGKGRAPAIRGAPGRGQHGRAGRHGGDGRGTETGLGRPRLQSPPLPWEDYAL